MTQAKFSYTAHPDLSVHLSASGLLDVGERMSRLALGVHPGRVPKLPLVSFMSFWDIFRRKPKDEEHSEEEGQKKRRGGWGVFRGGGHIAGGTGNSNFTGGGSFRHHSSAGGMGHSHGGIGGVGHGHGGGVSG